MATGAQRLEKCEPPMNEKVVRPYQICVRCVMDSSDPLIEFSEDGQCNHCARFDALGPKIWLRGDEAERKLQKTIDEIKMAGRGKRYDCVLGLSGGVDSSYLALRAFEWGLRPLVVHVDAGWNSELAVANIEKIITHCGFDLFTHVIEWEDMRDLQISYLKAAIANQDVPQDHIFFTSLYRFALKNQITSVLSGGNFATESVFPSAWHHSAMDAINLRAIHKKFGSGRLRNYKTTSFFSYYLYFPLLRGLKVHRLLNLIDYNKNDALNTLERTVGYKPYPRKHGETIFTKVFQNYYLPEKFGFDKRRPHLSSLILSEQISRTEALAELSKPLYRPLELEEDLNFLCRKLEISREDLQELIMRPNTQYNAFRNWDLLQTGARAALKPLERISGKKFKVHY